MITEMVTEIKGCAVQSFREVTSKKTGLTSVYAKVAMVGDSIEVPLIDPIQKDKIPLNKWGSALIVTGTRSGVREYTPDNGNTQHFASVDPYFQHLTDFKAYGK